MRFFSTYILIKTSLMKHKIATLLFLAAITYATAFGQPGSLDKSFGKAGKVTVSFGTQEDIGRKAVLQTDGKIVQTGTAGTSVAVVRYNTDGTPDRSFDGDGKVTTSIGGYDDEGYDVAIQQDGKIVVGGFSNDSFGIGDFALLRYNSDGSLDTTFNGSGKVITDMEFNSDDGCLSLIIQPDGKILAAGYSTRNVNIALARYNSDGSLDSSFGEDGKVIMSVPADIFGGIAFSVVIQSDAKILIAGSVDVDFLLIRYNADGSLDSSFGEDGIVRTDIGGFDFTDFGFSAALQPDQKIIVAGSAYTTTVSIGVARYNTDGSLDSSFGGDGKITTVVGSQCLASSVAVQPNGLILVAGLSEAMNYDFALVRYDVDGSLDSSFGSNGIVTTDFNNGDDQAESVIFTSENKIVVTGSSLRGFAAARYNSEGALPVALFNFKAELKGNNAFLYWSTATEQNSSYFNIQRSLDGIHFNSVSRVNSAGLSNIHKEYSYTDVNITALSSPRVYYRLLQADRNGLTTYSEIRSIELSKRAMFTIYPNPSQDIIFVQTSGKATLTLTDQSGKILLTQTIEGNGVISVASLPAGLYYLKNTSTGTTQKVIIAK
jgi:uncharacterized delta-60 repeat protein